MVPQAPTLVHAHSIRITGADGVAYQPVTYARAESESMWLGWIEFRPEGGKGRVLTTDTETSQPTLEAVAYWASGLQPIYFEGALHRAARRREHDP